MGKKEKAPVKTVLDTNILVSAILFKGELARLVDLWEGRKIVPVVSRETFDEFRAVLGYPKFRLTKGEIKAIIEEILPFFEVVETDKAVSGICKDPDDDKFITCAIAAAADFIITGDNDLCDVASYRSVRIIRASALLKMFE